MAAAEVSLYQRFGKRAFDVAASAALLALTAPVHLAAAVVVAVDDGLPVYFRQTRAGRDGRPFPLYKLRTMRRGTDEAFGGYPTPDAVTRSGRFLRRTSLDELPQLVSILRGDMSLVGPRPALMEQVERYTTLQRRRLAVRPGLTGLAQVRHRNAAPWSRRILTDIDYVDRGSFGLDVAILLRTIPAVLGGRGQQVGQSASDVDDLAARPSHEAGGE